MAETLYDYSPANTTVNWAGIDFSGYAPDTFITMSRSMANTTPSVGADGTVGITKNADKTGTIEVTLMQNSGTHKYLSAIQNSQDGDEDSLFRAPMVVYDPSGGWIALLENVHIQTPPEVSLGADQNPKTWGFYSEKVTYTDAPPGFTQSAGEIARIANALAGAIEIRDKIIEALTA